MDYTTAVVVDILLDCVLVGTVPAAVERMVSRQVELLQDVRNYFPFPDTQAVVQRAFVRYSHSSRSGRDFLPLVDAEPRQQVLHGLYWRWWQLEILGELLAWRHFALVVRIGCFVYGSIARDREFSHGSLSVALWPLPGVGTRRAGKGGGLSTGTWLRFSSRLNCETRSC